MLTEQKDHQRTQLVTVGRQQLFVYEKHMKMWAQMYHHGTHEVQRQDRLVAWSLGHKGGDRYPTLHDLYEVRPLQVGDSGPNMLLVSAQGKVVRITRRPALLPYNEVFVWLPEDLGVKVRPAVRPDGQLDPYVTSIRWNISVMAATSPRSQSIRQIHLSTVEEFNQLWPEHQL